jgi:DNA-binding CsgD family transcriptional regulator
MGRKRMHTAGSSSLNNDILTSLDEIITSIASQANIEEIESEYLNSINKLIPAHATALYFFKPLKEKPVRISASGVDVDFLRFYEHKGREVDPLRRWITSKRTPYQSQLLLGLEGWQHHPVYNIVKTASIDFAMQSPLVFGDDVIGTLNFGREVSEGPFTENDLRAISIMSRFMSLSVAGALGCGGETAYRKRIFEAMDRIRQGIIVTDSDYATRYANNSAKIITKRALGREDPAGNLKLLLRKESLQQGISGKAQTKNLCASFCPVPGSKGRQSLVILNEVSPIEKFSRFRDTLSARELEVLQHVEIGMQNREIAAEMGISVNTVKRHLDNLFLKMNVNSRTQLVSKMYRILEETDPESRT